MIAMESPNMKKHTEIIAILLSLTLSTFALADSAKNRRDEPSKETPKSTEKKATTTLEANAEDGAEDDSTEKKAADTLPSPENPNPGAKDEESASDDEKAKIPGGTIEDEKSADEGDTKKEEESKRIQPVVFKTFNSKEAEKIMPAKYRKVWEKAGVPKRALFNILSFLLDKDANNSKIDNERMVIIDFTRPSTEQRMYILNLKTGNYAQRFAAHGKKSGNLYASEFSKSNQKNSFQTTVGFHLFSDVYSGRHGKSYHLDGLEERNSNARDRDIVIHGAMYATTDFVEMRKKQGTLVRLGLSLGCPAVSPNTMDLLLELRLTNALLYNYTNLDKGAKVLVIK